jgi:hypothetical protein
VTDTAFFTAAGSGDGITVLTLEGANIAPCVSSYYADKDSDTAKDTSTLSLKGLGDVQLKMFPLNLQFFFNTETKSSWANTCGRFYITKEKGEDAGATSTFHKVIDGYGMTGDRQFAVTIYSCKCLSEYIHEPGTYYVYGAVYGAPVSDGGQVKTVGPRHTLIVTD